MTAMLETPAPSASTMRPPQDTDALTLRLMELGIRPVWFTSDDGPRVLYNLIARHSYGGPVQEMLAYRVECPPGSALDDGELLDGDVYYLRVDAHGARTIARMIDGARPTFAMLEEMVAHSISPWGILEWANDFLAIGIETDRLPAVERALANAIKSRFIRWSDIREGLLDLFRILDGDEASKATESLANGRLSVLRRQVEDLSRLVGDTTDAAQIRALLIDVIMELLDLAVLGGTDE